MLSVFSSTFLAVYTPACLAGAGATDDGRMTVLCLQARAALKQIRAVVQSRDAVGNPNRTWEDMVAALRKVLQRCSVSSDSFGSLPVFDSNGKLLEYKARHHCRSACTKMNPIGML